MAQRTRIAEIDEHKVHTGETLDTLAATAGMTRDELARFNWRTSLPDKVNEHLRTDVGCTRRDTAGNYVFDDTNDPGIVLIPRTFQRDGLPTGELHTIRVRPIAPRKNLIECVCIPGVTFEFDNSFIRPTVVNHMEKLDQAMERSPDAKVIVMGHTDRVGSEQYNKELSERRARSAYAFVTNQPDIWEELYNQEHWGTTVIQEILTDLGYDPGPVNGVQGDQTTAAIKAFQADRGLKVDGVAGPITRRQMFLDYMTGKHDVQIADDQFFPPKFMGCGEFNPLVPPNENELANAGRGRRPGNEPNRRVVFFLFQNPPTSMPCKLKQLAPCKAQIAQPGERDNPLHACAYYDAISVQCRCELGGTDPESLVHISVLLRSNSGAVPLANRKYKIFLEEGQVLEGTTDREGLVSHEDVPPGDYPLEIEGRGVPTRVPTVPNNVTRRTLRVKGYYLFEETQGDLPKVDPNESIQVAESTDEQGWRNV